MAEKRVATTPKEITAILALREAGYTVLAISHKINKSPRTVNRILSEHGAKKGSLKLEVIETAKNELLKIVTSDDAIRLEAAKLITDDLAHANRIRQLLIDASEHLTASNLNEAALVMRSLAAYSTAYKNTSDSLRRILNIDGVTEDIESIPELVICELTEKDIEDIIDESSKRASKFD